MTMQDDSNNKKKKKDAEGKCARIPEVLVADYCLFYLSARDSS